MAISYACTKAIVRNGRHGRCGATPARWTGKNYRCRRHEAEGNRPS